MNRLLVSGAVIALAACPVQSQGAEANAPASHLVTPAKTDAPSGAYTLDKAHASLLFRVNHLGFSQYTASFSRFDAALTLDVARPEASSVSATIDAASLTLPSPPPGFTDTLRGPQWLDAAQYPEITFRSTKVEMTAPNAAAITGDFTLHGITRPVTLNAVFNGGYAGHPMDPHARIGFSAHGTLKRSDYGIAFGIPEPGSTMGVGDEVDVVIEAEFSGPPLSEDRATSDQE